jgi:hypothetical protein
MVWGKLKSSFLLVHQPSAGQYRLLKFILSLTMVLSNLFAVTLQRNALASLVATEFFLSGQRDDPPCMSETTDGDLTIKFSCNNLSSQL